MMEFEKYCKIWGIYSAIIALLYLIYGVLEVIYGMISWWLPWIELPEIQLGITLSVPGDKETSYIYIPKIIADPFAGLILVFVSMIFMKASINLFRTKVEGWSFITVGLLLSSALFTLNVLIVLANGADVYYPMLWGEVPEEEWNVLADEWMFNPMMVMFMPTIPLIKVYKEREEFLSKAKT